MSNVPGDYLLLNVREVAKVLRLSERTVWTYAQNGLMPPPLRIGRSRRWSKELLEDWITRGCPVCSKEVAQ